MQRCMQQTLTDTAAAAASTNARTPRDPHSAAHRHHQQHTYHARPTCASQHTTSASVGLVCGVSRSSTTMMTASGSSGSDAQQQQQQQQHEDAAAAAAAAATRAKRTRGPRSCLECRQSKQRCEQLNFAAIVPSAAPQPPHMACRRCRVLQLACVVQDQLPKSTRLRIERSKSTRDGLGDSNSGDVAPSTSHPNHSLIMQPNAQTTATSASSSSRPSFGEESDHAAFQRSFLQQRAGSNGGMISPQSAGPTTSPYHTTHSGKPASTGFDPAVFDPLPVLQSQTAAAAATSSPLGAAATSASMGPSVLQQTSTASASGSPHSHFSAGSGPATGVGSGSGGGNDAPNAGDPTWFYRARIACRPTQLLEHLLTSAHAGPAETWWPRLLTPPSAPSLEDVVLHLAGDAAFLSRVVGRLTVMQLSTFPFQPDAQVILDDVEQSAFLLGVAMYLEGGYYANEEAGRLLHDRLAERCFAHVEQQVPTNMYDVCALVVVSYMCPLLLRTPSLVGAVAGNATLLCALRAANALGFAEAPARLAAVMDDNTTSGIPALNSPVVQSSMLWVYMYMQVSMLELLDEPMPAMGRRTSTLVPSTRPYPPPPPSHDRHPQTSPSAQALRKATRSDTEIVDRYCRAVLAVEAAPAAVPGDDDYEDNEHYVQRSSTALRCASMLLLVYAAQQTNAVSEAMRTFAAQFEDQVCQVMEAPARVTSLRRWTDSVIETLAMYMANARQALHELAVYLGARRVVSAEQLKYMELSLGALEFTCMCRMKDKLYVFGVKQLGACKTSHEFLFGIFARPQLLKSYEHLGLVRSCVAKHVLTLWSNLAMDLRLGSSGGGGGGGDGSSATEIATAWRMLGCVFPLARWSGMFVTCTTVLVEELAGRFMAQESPWGAQGESRLEVYYLVMRQTSDALVQLERDVLRRFGESDQEQLRPVRVALDALNKTLGALQTWRKKASGIGQYGPQRQRVQPQPQQPQQQQQPQQHQPASTMLSAAQPSQPTFATTTMPPPPSATMLSVDQVPFGDALLHDILYMPIEQFFDVK